MYHLFNKDGGTQVGTSVNAVDTAEVGHTAKIPASPEDIWDGANWVPAAPDSLAEPKVNLSSLVKLAELAPEDVDKLIALARSS